MVPGEERRAQNQRRFRRANQRLQASVDGMVTDDVPIPFLCECADADCVEPVRVTLGEYRNVRSDDARFLIVTGHPTVSGEAVVEDRGSYAVVVKSSA
jgi:hypothetical protein